MSYYKESYTSTTPERATLHLTITDRCVLRTYTRQIQRAALAMVDTLDHADEGLPNLLAVDDTLVDAVRKKLMSFIKQRLNIKKN